MMDKGNIQFCWQHYLDNVIPTDAPELQIKELRRAFYVGIGSLLTLMQVAIDEAGPKTAADMIDEIKDELNAFFEQVKNGVS